MTCIIGYKDKKNNKVYIGSDSCVSSGYNSEHTLDECYKIFKPDKNKNIAIAITGSVRALQVLKYHMEFPTEKELDANNEVFDDKYIITKLIPKLHNICDENKVLEKDNSVYLAFILAYKDKLWYIDSDFSLIKFTDEYLTHGCGLEFAEGSLYTTKDMDLNIPTKIRLALESSSIASGVSATYYIVNTIDDEVLKFEK